ncbi:hypothetical protein SSTG_03534 [Streptomyces sp. e14]|nr:hypothetical protein SSTG_03534 [Streptomyces sp. e14]
MRPRTEAATDLARGEATMSLCVPKSDESVIVRDAELLSGEDVVTAERGDLIVVPPGRPH